MRGTAAILVCLISLHYLSVIDAYSAKFTSENGMPGREHEDKHPRRSADEKRSLSETMRQEPDYNWENYGGIPNIPGYMYRDAYTDLDAYDEDDEYSFLEPLPRQQDLEDRHQRRSGAKRKMSASPDKTMRQYDHYQYDNMEQYGGIPNIPYITYDRAAGTEAETRADTDRNSFSKTVKRLLSPVVSAVRQLWGKLSGKSLDGVVGKDSRRENALNEPLKKQAMESRQDEYREANKRNIGNPINYLLELARKALDFAYNVIDKFDVSQLTEETKKLKEAVLDILKKAKEALEKLLNNVDGQAEPPSSRRARSVGKRTNARDALESYLTSLRSQKRSKTRHSFRRSMKGDTSARASDMTALMDMMTEMEDCIHAIPPTNTSTLGVQCIVLPLMKVLTSPKLGRANGLTVDEDSNVRFDAIEAADDLRRLSFPWGSVFLIPIYNGHRPWDNSTAPPCSDQGCDNATTTTTTEPPTTTTTLPTPVYDEPDRAVRSDGKYRSKYDHNF